MNKRYRRLWPLLYYFQSKLKPGLKEEEEVSKLTEETSILRAELDKLKASLSARENGSKWLGGGAEGAVVQRLDEQQEVIEEMRSMIEYQVRRWHKFGGNPV